jgi:hypothetical protein
MRKIDAEASARQAGGVSVDFLTFSNGAVGNGRERMVSAGKLAAKKPYKIALFGNDGTIRNPRV